MEFLRDFINNFAILIVLIFAYSRIFRYLQNHAVYRQFMNAGLFSIISLAVMISPVHFVPGLVFDTRSIVISASGLFCGPPGAIITAVMSSLLRIYQGGVGTATGVSVISCSAILGVIYYFLRRKYVSAMKPLYIFLFGVVVHIAMLLCMFILPL